MVNDIKHMFTSFFSAFAHPIVEINDTTFADVPYAPLPWMQMI